MYRKSSISLPQALLNFSDDYNEVTEIAKKNKETIDTHLEKGIVINAQC